MPPSMHRSFLISCFLFACSDGARTGAHRMEKPVPDQAIAVSTYHKPDESAFIEIARFPNGRVRRIVEQGMEQACGVSVGTHYYFDSAGHLEKQVVFEHDWPEDGTGCLDLVQTRTEYLFHADGAMKARRQFRATYEGEERRTGVWVEYDPQGKEIWSKAYGADGATEAVAPDS